MNDEPTITGVPAMNAVMESKAEAAAVSVAQRLRELADWIEQHEVANEDVVSCSVNGWGGQTAHLEQRAVIRICGGERISLSIGNDRVHGTSSDGEVSVVFCS